MLLIARRFAYIRIGELPTLYFALVAVASDLLYYFKPRSHIKLSFELRAFSFEVGMAITVQPTVKGFKAF